MSYEEEERHKPRHEVGDFACFGEYGSRTACRECLNKNTCKNFTHEKQTSIYRKYKAKHKGRGKWSRKDLY